MARNPDDERPRRALIVEGNPVEARFMRQMLSRAREGGSLDRPIFEAELAGGLEASLLLIAEKTFDVVLLDLNLPDSHGLTTFERLKAQAPELPIVVLTDETDEELAMAAVKRGAQDYLDKATVTSKLLVRFLRYAMERHRLLSDVRALASAASARDRQSRQVIDKLQHGFARLASGDLAVRVAAGPEDPKEPADLATLLASFDRTVSELGIAGEVKAQFQAMAAHDMRSPLASIQLAVGALDQPGLEPAQKLSIKALVGRQIRKLVQLMDGLLDFFVITSGALKLSLEPVDADELVRDCARDLEGLAAERGQTFTVLAGTGGTLLHCDRTKIVRVLDNLATNAIKYSIQGDCISMSTTCVGGERVRFEIRDHGPGLPESELDRVFEKFHRTVDGSRKIQGSGLGLAICKDYVVAHHGRIWVESRPGEGCCFCFELPLAPPEHSGPIG